MTSLAVFIQSALSTLCRTILDYDQAINHASIALKTKEQRLSRDKVTIASCYDFIEWCHYTKTEYHKALDFCTKGLHLLLTYALESDARCWNIYHSLGAIWLELGDLKQSLVYCIKAIHILADNLNFEGQKSIIDEFFLLLDRIRKRENDASKALSSPEISSGISETYQDPHLSLYIEAAEVLQSEPFSDATRTQTITTTECNSGDDIRKNPCIA
jgi:tetratricopeptide (TPR) repeat protein